jgi:colicin import membrane protein
MAPKELSNLAGLLRSGHRGAIDEDGFSRVGADSNLFHQGAAKESDDPELVSATVANPVSSTPPRGVGGPVHRRCSPARRICRMTRASRSPKESRRRPKKQPPAKNDDKAAHRAALEYERAERPHEGERRKEEAARAKVRQRRDLATAKAKAALEKSEREHDSMATAVEADRLALEKRSQADNARVGRCRRQKLDLAVHRARK